MAMVRDRADNSKLAAVWNFILKYTVGYGYYPERALFCLFGLVVLGSALFFGAYSTGSMVPTDKDAYHSFRNNRTLPEYHERFHACAYSLENAFPLVKLGQVDRWQPDPGSAALLRLFRWGQIVLGWFFATMGIAAVTGIVRKD